MRKISHLTSVHARFDTRIFLKECISLADYGYSVSLVVADGKGCEEKNGVIIYDVGASRSRLDRIRMAPKRILAKALTLNSDIYHLHDPELIFVGLKLKKLGKKVIFDIHEMTRLQILSKKWIPTMFRRSMSTLYGMLENHACKKFDHLITPQNEMTRYFSRFSESSTIFNYPDHDFVLNRDGASRFNIIYSGSISEDRGLSNYVKLIEELIKIDSRYQLILACPTSKEVLTAVNSSDASSNIRVVGYVCFNELLDLYSSSMFGLVLFNNVGQYYMANALKLFEYMGSGLVVIMPDFGDWVTFNEANKVGFNVKTNSPAKIADLINDCRLEDLDKLSSSNHKLVMEKYSWAAQEEKFINIYKKVLDV